MLSKGSFKTRILFLFISINLIKHFLHCRMRSLLILGCTFLLALAFDEFAMPDGDDAVLSGPNVVVDLTRDNFTQFIQQHPVVLAEFYAPW